MKNLRRLVLLAALAPAAYSQSVIYTLAGDGDPDSFGYRVSGAGDVNGDGVPDLVVGAPGDGGNNGTKVGTVRVFSGLDGSLLYTFEGDENGDGLGISISGAGDVNGDGFADLIVGAARSGTPSYVRVFSGQNGSIIYNFFGDSANDFFGRSVSGAGDVDGDGFDDLIVGGSEDNTNAEDSGYARVFSGQDGSIIYTFYGAAVDEDHYGFSVSGAGDVDGDGFDDLIVGAIGTFTSNGRAEVLSGVDGSILYTFFGDSAPDRFGSSVSGPGDVNGDGFADLIVGAPGDDNNGGDSGSARVFSGANGSWLYTFDGDGADDKFGSSVSGAGDVNGDGFADLIVGAYADDNNGTYSGSARVFSGSDGSILFTVDGDSVGDSLGQRVSGAGDIDGDGFADLIVGAPQNHGGGSVVGYARVFSGCDVCDVGTNYCGPANLNSTGQSAVISAAGSVLVQKNLLALTASQLPLNKSGYFLNSDVQDFKPFAGGSSGNLCLGGGIGRHAKQIANSGAAGELILDLDLTALPRPNGTHSVVAGETWNFQCWFRDKVAGQSTSNFTDGIEILFQ